MTQRQEDLAGEAKTSLDDLFNDAELAKAAKNPKQRRVSDPSLRNALDAEAKRMRDLYILPENWERTRGIALIDKASQTLVGNFSEYTHRSIPHCRKLLREHLPISIDAAELCEGYLGEVFEMRLRGTWEDLRHGAADLWFDEMLIGAPKVKFEAKIRLGVIVRVDLLEDVQLASNNASTLLCLPAGTNVLNALSQDSKAAVRKAVGL